MMGYLHHSGLLFDALRRLILDIDDHVAPPRKNDTSKGHACNGIRDA
jgi:hypothetical protein